MPQYYVVRKYYRHKPQYYGHKPHYDVYASRPHPQHPAPQARLGNPRGGATSPILKPVQASAPPQGQRQSREDLLWESAQRSNLRADYEAYLDVFPNGFFAQMAKNRIASLAAVQHPANQLTGSTTANTLNRNALAWAKSNLGSSKWNGHCEQFVEQATYGKYIGYLTASIAWNDYVNKGASCRTA